MVSPSKAKLSRIASQQSQQQQQPEPQPSSQQQPPQRKSVASTSSTTSNNNKVKLVKGSKPLIHHRFYLDIERHQVATKIESTIKELGGVSAVHRRLGLSSFRF
ncbi:hypothetical protein AND_009334 [Anopheles darlingi]|uniref:Uncharacterized protein n=1 Tax=Anopheles darlingi TaxID=43151 RepID=W5J8G7_ANODA|nr:hypothetical protein AND_009334 [Anopheles darlingi]